jgi:hypothetical protein
MKKLYAIAVLIFFTLTSSAQADLHVANVIPGPYLRPGTYTFTFGLENLGAQGCGIRVYWQVDNGPVYNRLPYTPGGLNAHQGVTQVVSDSFRITVTTASKIFKVWAVPLNGVTDANHANDTFIHVLKVRNDIPDKNVVLEVYKHQICGPCYPAAEYNHQYIEPMQNHNIVYLYTDPNDVLYNADAAAINKVYNFAHPAPMFDRYKFPYFPDIMTGYFTLDNVYQLREQGRRDIMYEPLGVSIAYMSLDTTTRKLRVRVKAKTIDTIAGDLRFNLWITEDSIKAYQAEAPNPNNYWHSHVLRSFVGGQWGVAGSMPKTMYPGQESTYDFQYTVPANYVLKRLNVIGLVQIYNKDSFARRIVNSARARATQKLGIAELPVLTDIQVYPNPAKEQIWIKNSQSKTETLQISLYNSLGQMIIQKEMKSAVESLDIHQFPAGNYVLQIVSERGHFEYPLVKVE